MKLIIFAASIILTLSTSSAQACSLHLDNSRTSNETRDEAYQERESKAVNLGDKEEKKTMATISPYLGENL